MKPSWGHYTAGISRLGGCYIMTKDLPYDGFAAWRPGSKTYCAFGFGVIDPDHPLEPSPHEKHAGRGLG